MNCVICVICVMWYMCGTSTSLPLIGNDLAPRSFWLQGHEPLARTHTFQGTFWNHHSLHRYPETRTVIVFWVSSLLPLQPHGQCEFDSFGSWLCNRRIIEGGQQNIPLALILKSEGVGLVLQLSFCVSFFGYRSWFSTTSRFLSSPLVSSPSTPLSLSSPSIQKSKNGWAVPRLKLGFKQGKRILGKAKLCSSLT